MALSTALALLCAAAACAQVTVGNPWVRAPVPGQPAVGAYMEITSARTSYLIGCKSPLSRSAEVHETTMESGVMKMRPVKAIELPARQTIELKPGGYHIMLVGLKQPIKEGDTVPLTLIFESKDKTRETVEVKAPVRAFDAAQGMQNMH